MGRIIIYADARDNICLGLRCGHRGPQEGEGETFLHA